MRLFVAIDLSPTVRAGLAALLDQLRPVTKAVRWVNPAGMHITLKFLGETPPEKLDSIRQALAAAHSSKSVEMSFRRLGFFPNERHPRVLWVGIEATPNLAELAAQVEAALEPLGFVREKRAFVPHLTLGRFRVPEPGSGLVARARELEDREFGRQTAAEFFLFESRLSPRGASYTKLERFDFVRG